MNTARFELGQRCRPGVAAQSPGAGHRRVEDAAGALGRAWPRRVRVQRGHPRLARVVREARQVDQHVPVRGLGIRPSLHLAQRELIERPAARGVGELLGIRALHRARGKPRGVIRPRPLKRGTERPRLGRGIAWVLAVGKTRERLGPLPQAVRARAAVSPPPALPGIIRALLRRALALGELPHLAREVLHTRVVRVGKKRREVRFRPLRERNGAPGV